MNDYGHIGGAFAALERLTTLGVIATLILGVLTLAGAIAGLWWAWSHLSVAIS
jgi:hypothetical protein